MIYTLTFDYAPNDIVYAATSEKLCEIYARNICQLVEGYSINELHVDQYATELLAGKKFYSMECLNTGEIKQVNQYGGTYEEHVHYHSPFVAAMYLWAKDEKSARRRGTANLRFIVNNKLWGELEKLLPDSELVHEHIFKVYPK